MGERVVMRKDGSTARYVSMVRYALIFAKPELHNQVFCTIFLH